jgi:hypothetical protein
MAKVNGTDLTIVVDGDSIDCQITGTLTTDRDLPDASCKDDGGWATHIQGQGSWSMEGSARLDYTATFGYAELVALSINRTEITELDFLSSTVGGIRARGAASVASINITADNESSAEFDFSFTGNGALAVTAVT